MEVLTTTAVRPFEIGDIVKISMLIALLMRGSRLTHHFSPTFR